MVVTTAERRLLAQQVAARLARDPAVTSAFITGSLVVGLGNHTSDIDVYLAGPAVVPGRQQIFAGPVRVDVHRCTTGALSMVVDRVVHATIRSDDGADVLSDRDVTTAQHLSCAEIVVDGGARALQQSLREHDDALRQLLLTRWLNLAHYGQEDLAGLVDQPAEGDAATMVARLLLRTAGKALAAACGDFFPGEKWVWRQLDRSAPDGFPHERYRELSRADPLAPGTGPRLADLRHFAQTCTGAAATLGWHGVPLEHWPGWLPGDGPLRRLPDLSIRAYRDAAILTFPDSRRIRVSHEAALIWALCDGTDETTLVRQACQLSTRHPRYATLDEARVADLLDVLLRGRLIQRGHG